MRKSLATVVKNDPYYSCQGAAQDREKNEFRWITADRGLSNGGVDMAKDSTKDQVKGKVHEVKGKIKEKAGRVMNNRDLEAEGQDEKVSGKVQKKVGQVEKVFGK